MTWSMWASAAEQASEALLAMQPNWLMFVEGVSSANDCSGALTRPIKLSIPDRVVYSSHVYSWSGWGALVPYHKRPYPSFAKDMEQNWAYLLRSNTAPVWVGEFGVPHNASEGDLHYWNHLMKFLRDVDADFGYWALNPRKPEKYDDETYGLLEKDWETVVEDYRMKGMRELMGK
jgi:endoglucanase